MSPINIILSDETLEVLSRFEKAGFDAFVVGGSLRDSLLGRPAFDTDIASNALPEQTSLLFSDKQVIPTGIKHGTVTLLTDSGAAIEITTFRTDGSYSDARHPDSVSFTSSIEDDLSRRDFTVNAMAYNPERGLIDLFDGKKDLLLKTIRCVGDPEKRFSEDALRILRAFRFSAQLDFAVEEQTLRAAIKLGPTLSKIAKERISSEFIKLLASPRPASTLSALSPLLENILPSVEPDPLRFSLCDSLPSDPIARLALILLGSEKQLSIARLLRLSSKDTKRLDRLCKADASAADITTPAQARRLLFDFDACLNDAWLFIQINALILRKDPAKALALLDTEAALSPCLSLSSLEIDGNDLISNGVASGKQVGIILRRLLDSVILDPSLNEKERLLSLSFKLSKEL